jgi:hypothetical protein
LHTNSDELYNIRHLDAFAAGLIHLKKPSGGPNEWVHRKASSQKLKITKEGNCFTSFQTDADLDGLCNIAETLCQKGQLQACDRWVYQ